MIDWNKARKLLRNWVAKNDAAGILAWGARHRIGHRAFLELGGDELIGAAVRNAAPTRIGFGERLDQVLGRDGAVDFLKATLRASTEALSAGRSVRLVRDHIEADLVRRLESVDSTLLAIVVRQAGLAHDIAAALAHHIAALQTGRPADGKLLAARAGRIEQKADRIAIEARKEVTRLNARPIIEESDGPRRGSHRRTGTGRFHRLAGAGWNRSGIAAGACRVVQDRHFRNRSDSLGFWLLPPTFRRDAAPTPTTR